MRATPDQDIPETILAISGCAGLVVPALVERDVPVRGLSQPGASRQGKALWRDGTGKQ